MRNVTREDARKLRELYQRKNSNEDDLGDWLRSMKQCGLVVADDKEKARPSDRASESIS